MLIIDFLRGLIYEINDSTKTYTVDSIRSKPINSLFSRYQKSGKKKNIIGQPCSEFHYIDTAKSEFIGNIDFSFWYADALDFPVSEKYLKSDEIVMFTNGRNIGMGMNMKMEIFSKETFLALQPIQIEAMPLAQTIFDLPPGYLKRKDSLHSINETGSLQPGNNITIELSEVKAEPPPPPPPPPPSVPAKKKRKQER